MDPIRKRELKRQARMRLSAQRRRAGLLRGRVVVLSLICFALLWGVVFAQMATGNDPVLAAKEAAAKTRTNEEASEAEPVEEEAEAELVEAEPEAEAEEFVEGEAEAEEVETEPLVTSQS